MTSPTWRSVRTAACKFVWSVLHWPRLMSCWHSVKLPRPLRLLNSTDPMTTHLVRRPRQKKKKKYLAWCCLHSNWTTEAAEGTSWSLQHWTAVILLSLVHSPFAYEVILIGLLLTNDHKTRAMASNCLPKRRIISPANAVQMIHLVQACADFTGSQQDPFITPPPTRHPTAIRIHTKSIEWCMCNWLPAVTHDEALQHWNTGTSSPTVQAGLPGGKSHTDYRLTAMEEAVTLVIIWLQSGTLSIKILLYNARKWEKNVWRAFTLRTWHTPWGCLASTGSPTKQSNIFKETHLKVQRGKFGLIQGFYFGRSLPYCPWTHQ